MSILIKKIFIFSILLSSLIYSQSQVYRIKVMILPFMDIGETAQFSDIGMNIPDLISSNIRKLKNIDLFEQSDVVEVIKQMKGDIFDINEKRLKELEEIINVDYLVSGNLAAFSEEIKISCNIYNVQASSLLNSFEIGGKSSELSKMIEELGEEILMNLKEAVFEEIKYSSGKIFFDKVLIINPWETPRNLFSYEDINFPEIDFNISYSRGFTKITEIDSNGREKGTPQTWGCDSITVYVENIDGYKAEYEFGLELALTRFGVATKHSRVHSIKSYRDFKEGGSPLLKSEFDLLDYDVKDLEHRSSKLFGSTSCRVYHQSGYSDLYDVDYVYDYSIKWIKLKIKVMIN